MPSGAMQELTLEETMRGLLALQIADREERIAGAGSPRRTDLVLADAGLSYAVIAALTGKKANTVAKAVERHRKGKDTAGDERDA
jgi:DNA-directed RNA polymerase specialized sigma24 family protein